MLNHYAPEGVRDSIEILIYVPVPFIFNDLCHRTASRILDLRRSTVLITAFLILVNLKSKIAPTEDACVSTVPKSHLFWSMHPCDAVCVS